MSRTGVARPAFPANLRKLQLQFATEEAYQSPDGARAGRHGPWGRTTTCWGLLTQPEKLEMAIAVQAFRLLRQPDPPRGHP